MSPCKVPTSLGTSELISIYAGRNEPQVEKVAAVMLLYYCWY